MQARLTGIAAIVIAINLIVVAVGSSGAIAPANQHIERTWERTDRPVADGAVSRTWMWGPAANHGAFFEEYAEAPGGERLVQYYDKSRMEITDPNSDASSIWYVTNGLLVVELISGDMQVADNAFVDRDPAEIPVAGDNNDPDSPTYATFAGLLGAGPLADGATIVQVVDRSGNVTTDPSLAGYGATAAYRVTVPNLDHQVGSPFWEFMNASGTVYVDGGLTTDQLFESAFYATGFPITEAYWAEVKVGGTARLVLMQCFERRCLTFTPGNPDGWQVEAGNVGLHYYAWRYGQNVTPTATGTTIASPPATTTSTVPVTGTVTQSPTWTATATQSPTGTSTATHTASPTQTSTATYAPTATSTPTSTPTVTPTYTPTPPVGPNGRVYVVDWGADRVLVFDLRGLYLFSFGEFDNPHGVAVDQQRGWVYVADTNNHRIQKFDLDGVLLASWGDYGQAAGQIAAPSGVAVGPSGRVWVTDTYHRVQRFTTSGTYINGWGGPPLGSADGQFNKARGVTVTDNGTVYVVDKDNNRIQKFQPDGTWLASWGSEGSGSGEYYRPEYITSDSSGNLWVADSFNHRIVRTDTSGNVELIWDGGSGSEEIKTPYGVAIAEGTTVAGTDVLYVAENGNGHVVAYDGNTGERLFVVGSPGAEEWQFDSIVGVAVYIEDGS